MPGYDREFAKYVEFADILERELITFHGKAKAKKLFTRMDKTKFQEFCEAATTDALKRQWLKKILAGYPQPNETWGDAA